MEQRVRPSPTDRVSSSLQKSCTLIEFKVHDVDGEYERLQPLVSDWVLQPTTMPWGNRSILFRDPDGNLVNFFTPVTREAIKKFNG